MIIKVCEACTPRKVEELTKYFGHGECEACGAAGVELRGHKLARVLEALKARETEGHAPGDLNFRNDTLSVDLWYPNIDQRPGDPPRTFDHPVAVEVGLMHVRAADDIRIEYDFARDGYVIKQGSKFEWAVDDQVCDRDWQEVAFVEAWGREVSPTEPVPGTERDT